MKYHINYSFDLKLNWIIILLVIDFFGYGTVFRVGERLRATEESFLGQSNSTFIIELVTLFYQRFSIGFDLWKSNPVIVTSFDIII
jgi:hypothetical protein